jgi:hypothetical protein
MCDAVQAEKYEIDGVQVSNFVLPLYFTGTRDTDEVGARNDFLGRSYGGQTLRSFGINPGGYVGFFDPETGGHETFSIRGDAVAAERMAMKAKAKEARRSIRYRDPKARERIEQLIEAAACTDGRRAGNARKRAAAMAAAPRRSFGPVALTRPAAGNGHAAAAAAARKPANGGRPKRPGKPATTTAASAKS